MCLIKPSDRLGIRVVYVYKTVNDCMLLIGFDFVGGVQTACARVTKQRDDIVLRGGHSAIFFGSVTERNVGRSVPSS
jgi:hypothetical protein